MFVYSKLWLLLLGFGGNISFFNFRSITNYSRLPKVLIGGYKVIYYLKNYYIETIYNGQRLAWGHFNIFKETKKNIARIYTYIKKK